MRHYPELEENKFHIYISTNPTSRKHGHTFLEFAYISQGSIVHRINGSTEILQTGDYFIIDFGTEHEYHALPGEAQSVINLMFYPEFIDRSLASCRGFEDVVNSYLVRFSYRTLKDIPTGKTFHDNDRTVQHILANTVREYADKKPGYMAYIRCLLIEMLIHTMRQIGNDPAKHSMSDTIQQITSYLQVHFAEKITLSDIARQYNYSLPHLSKKFHQETGFGFTEYIQRIRLEQSCRLLEYSDKPVCEIAALCGYNDIKSFNRLFQKIIHMTPREFRKRNLP